MKRNLSIFVAATAAVTLFAAACPLNCFSAKTVYAEETSSASDETQDSSAITVTDAKGREVTLDAPVETYAVSTIDVVDYLIPLLGSEAFDMLVGTGQDGGGGIQKYESLYTPIVGDYMSHVGQISEHNAPFDLEMILDKDPDVLIVNSAMGAHQYALDIEDQLTEAGIKIILIDVPGTSVSTSVQDTEELLGKIFQKEDRAQEVIDFMDSQFDQITSRNLSERTDKPTVYYEKGGSSTEFSTTSTSASGWGAVIAAAGGDNIADAFAAKNSSGQTDSGKKGGSGLTLDPEYILSADPDFIIQSGGGWMDHFEGSEPEADPDFDIVNRTGWSELNAVKNNNVYLFAHASNRTVYLFYPCLKLATLFYPEEFKDVDADAALDEFFEKFMLTDSSVTNWFYQIGQES